MDNQGTLAKEALNSYQDVLFALVLNTIFTCVYTTSDQASKAPSYIIYDEIYEWINWALYDTLPQMRNRQARANHVNQKTPRYIFVVGHRSQALIDATQVISWVSPEQCSATASAPEVAMPRRLSLRKYVKNKRIRELYMSIYKTLYNRGSVKYTIGG